MMNKAHIAALALAGVVATTVVTPSFADSYHYGPGYAYQPYAYEGYAYAPATRSYAPGYSAYSYAPGYTAYSYAPGYSVYSYGPNYDPENGYDPDPRVGGSFRMNSSGDD
jgi:hypothetical protein